MKRKLFSIDTQLYKVTGVEKVMLDVHNAVKGEYQAKIVGTISFKKVRKEHNISKEEYIKLSNPFMFYNSIVIVHERKLLILFWLLNHLFLQHIKIVYIHHNLFYNHKLLTILPETIVAIAERGIENLIDFFGASPSNIHKIYNCVKDSYQNAHRGINNNRITLVLPGRINAQKQQLEIVRHLKGKLNKNILIRFAGDGPQLKELIETCKGDDNFEVLGFRNDVIDLLKDSDFILLYSVHEGLPITLIEATMMGMPIICSDVGGNAEICHNGENGWVLNDWQKLINTLNNLPNISETEYCRMCEASRRIYKENFTPEIFEEKYLKLLKPLR